MSSKQMSAFQKKKRHDNVAGYVFLIPAIITFLLFVGGPMIISFVLSFFDYNLIQPPEFIGMKNIRKFMMDPQVRISFANTFKFLLILVPVHCFLGMLLAFAVSCVHHKKDGIPQYPLLSYGCNYSVCSDCVGIYVWNRHRCHQLLCTSDGWQQCTVADR